MVKLQADDLKAISGTYLPGIAACYRTASTALSGAGSYSSWERQGGLGTGPSGPYLGWDSVRRALVDVLEDSRQACEDAASQLEIAARFHGDADAAASADLAQNEAAVEAAEAARNRPTAPGPGGRQIPV